MASIPATLTTTQPASDLRGAGAIAVLSLLWFMPATVCFWSIPPDDPDVWWHLRTGQWILENRAWPTVDTFTCYGAGNSYPAYSWLPELILLGLYQGLGLRGLVLFSAAMCSAIAAAVYRLASRQGAGFLMAGSLALAAMLGMKPLMTARPWLFTILLFTIELDLLLSVRRSGRLKTLLWLPPLFCLWANAHIQFTVGLALLGLAAAEPVLARLLPNGMRKWIDSQSQLSPAAMPLVLFLCVAATLVNPYHARIYQTAVGLLNQPALWSCIDELAAMRFRSYANWAVLGVALAGVFALGRQRRQPLLLGLTFLAAIYLGFRSSRDVWLVLVVGVAVIARSLSMGKGSAIRLTRPAALAIAGAVGLLLGIGTRLLDDSTLQGQVAASYPAQAVEFLREQTGDGPVFSQFEWGGYLMFHLPGIPVNIDGRTIVHGQDRMLRNVNTLLGGPGWKDDPELLAARLVVVPTKYVLASLLKLDPRFRTLHEDPVTVVFGPAERDRPSDRTQRNKLALAGGDPSP